jgi:hypothetical protein
LKNFSYKPHKSDKLLHMTEVNYSEVQYMILRKDGRGGVVRSRKNPHRPPHRISTAYRLLADLARISKPATSSPRDAFASPALAKRLKIRLVTATLNSSHWKRKSGSTG